MIKLYATHPPFDTGHPKLDLTLTTLAFLALCSSVASIITALDSARNSFQARSSRNRGQYLEVQSRALAFIVLALLSLTIVTCLRYQHLNLPVPSAEELTAWAEDTASLLSGIEPKKRHVWDHLPHDTDEATSSVSSAASVAYAGLSSGASSLYEDVSSAAPPMSEVTSFAAHAAASVLSGARVAASVAGEAMEAVGSKVVQYAEHGTRAVASDASRAEKAAEGTVAVGWRRTVQYMRQVGEGMTRSGKKTAEQAQRELQSGAERAIEGGKAAWRGEKRIMARVAGKSKWVREALYGRASLWDLCKSLLSDSRRFWWAQQWGAGYMIWATFVGLEARSRGIATSIALSFVFAGYCLSLSAAQSLFFAYLLLRHPEKRRSMRRQPQTSHSDPVLIVLATFCELAWLWILHRQMQSSKDRAELRNFLQNAISIFPIVTTAVVKINRTLYRLRRMTSTIGPKHVMAITWWVVSLLCLTSHVYATYEAILKVDEILSWLDIRNIFGRQQKSPHILSSTMSIFSALGDDPWINAVGWDVIFSALALGIWTFVSDAQTMDVLKCAVWPLAPEALEVVEVAAEKAKPYVDAAADVVDPYVAASRRAVEWEAKAVRGVLRDIDTEAIVDGAKRGVETGVETGRRALSNAYEYLKKEMGGEGDEDEDFETSYRRGFRAASYSGPSGNLSKLKLRRGGGRTKQRDYIGEDDEGEEPQRTKQPQSPSKRRGRPPKALKGEDNGRTPSRSRSRSRGAVDRNVKSAAPSLERRGPLSRRRASASAAAASRNSVSQLAKNNLPLVSAETVTEGAEAAGLSWVLFILGGLGMLSAGVLGAEEAR